MDSKPVYKNDPETLKTPTLSFEWLQGPRPDWGREGMKMWQDTQKAGIGWSGLFCTVEACLFHRVEQRQINKAQGLGYPADQGAGLVHPGRSHLWGWGGHSARGKCPREGRCGRLFLPTPSTFVLSSKEGFASPLSRGLKAPWQSWVFVNNTSPKQKSPPTSMLKQRIYNICKSLK